MSAGAEETMAVDQETVTANRRMSQVIGGFYAVVLVGAGVGQFTGLSHWFPAWFALMIVAVVELGAVLFTSHADLRRRVGERAIPSRLFAAGLCGFAITVNWLGHEDRFAAVIYAGMSAIGFGTWLIVAGAHRRDWLRRKGLLAKPPPAYGLAQWLAHPQETRRAKALAVETPSLGVHGSLTLAKEEFATARRRAAIIKMVRKDTGAAFGPQYAELLITIADPDRLAAEIEKLTDWAGVAKVYANRVDPARLAAAARKRSRQDRAVTAQSGAQTDTEKRAEDRAAPRTETRGRPRAEAASTRGRNRAEDRAARGWWTTAREDFYTRIYAPELDTAGREVGGTDLASGLGVDGGNARRAREDKLRPRYVREVASGARQPRAPLPDVIAQKVAEVAGGARLTDELERMGDTHK